METTGIDGKELRLHQPTVERLLVDFIKDETRAAGFEKVVVGLSGGVDSAVAAFLAARALGPANVLGVMMPYRTSRAESASDAQLVVDHLGIRSEKVDITEMVEPYLTAHHVKENVRRGNIMARARMMVLYDLSARDGALVLGTSNKTEMMLGYGTVHGDTASALNPLGDLYKTQIWDLAVHVGVPEKIVQKPPTADLWEGQADETELGFKYRDVDRLLFAMIDERRSDEELALLGYGPRFVGKIRTLVRANQFKRRPPIVAKISFRTVNVDFRYVRDWGI